MPVHVVDHPVAAHYLTLLRDRETDPATFRLCCSRLSVFILNAATQELPTESRPIEGPLEPVEGRRLSARVIVVPILRAGLAMLQPALDLLPDVSVGYVGMERDEQTAQPRAYYDKLPDVVGHRVLVVDPMLATGGSAEATLERIAARGPASLSLVCIVAAPEGVERITARFPEVSIFTAGLDRELDANKYIRPGLGDFGDRLYGT